eukprot:Skav203304  [mRNA]  locus=scaffold2587:14775:16007:+ [translate_table: standard]
MIQAVDHCVAAQGAASYEGQVVKRVQGAKNVEMEVHQRSHHHFGIKASRLHRSNKNQVEELNHGAQTEDIFFKTFWRTLAIDQEAPSQVAAQVGKGLDQEEQHVRPEERCQSSSSCP